MKPAKRRLPLLALASLTALATVGLNAADLTWDSNGPDTGTGGTGNWNTSGLTWNNGSEFVAWNNAAGDNATLSGTNGTLTITEDITVNDLKLDAKYTISGSGTPSPILTITGTVNVTGGTSTISAKIGGTDFIKAGGSNLVLRGANLYTGTTRVLGGTLQARDANTLPTTTTVSLESASAGLDVRASQTVAGIANIDVGATITNTQTDGAGTRLTIDSDGAGAGATDSTFSGIIKDGASTPLILGITKAGSKTLTLTGTNSYTGTTIVEGGTMKLGTSLTGTTEVTVDGGVLSGNDASDNIDLGVGLVSMSSGGIAAGGMGTAGSFTVAADFTTTGGTLYFDLGTAFDQILGEGGTFSLTDTTLALSGDTSVTGSYELFSGFDGANSVTNLTITGLGEGYVGSLGLDGMLTITSTAIPEPSSMALLFGGAALAAGVLVRRKRIA